MCGQTYLKSLSCNIVITIISRHVCIYKAFEWDNAQEVSLQSLDSTSIYFFLSLICSLASIDAIYIFVI